VLACLCSSTPAPQRLKYLRPPTFPHFFYNSLSTPFSTHYSATKFIKTTSNINFPSTKTCLDVSTYFPKFIYALFGVSPRLFRCRCRFRMLELVKVEIWFLHRQLGVWCCTLPTNHITLHPSHLQPHSCITLPCTPFMPCSFYFIYGLTNSSLRWKRWQRPRKGRCQASSQDLARQHPGYHQARYPSSCPSWWCQAYLCQ
jgi:hypothetical protein